MEITTGAIIARLIIALLLGVLLGIERVFARKTAGMRTYGLVSMGAAMFIIISESVVEMYGVDVVNPLRVAAAVVSGIGFLGAGLIIFKNDHIANLTTAAGLWVAAGIGMAVGFGLMTPAIITTLMTLFVFAGLAFLERRLKLGIVHRAQKHHDDLK